MEAKLYPNSDTVTQGTFGKLYSSAALLKGKCPPFTSSYAFRSFSSVQSLYVDGFSLTEKGNALGNLDLLERIVRSLSGSGPGLNIFLADQQIGRRDTSSLSKFYLDTPYIAENSV